MTTTNRPPTAIERRATIDDVADAAGVSVATVSRALRGLPNVAAATRQRVLDVAERLRYAPDSSASRLAGGRTRTVAVVVSNFESWYVSQVLAAAESHLHEHGYDVLVLAVTSPERRREFVHKAARERRFDGVILVAISPSDDELDLLDQAGCRAVVIGPPPASRRPDVAYVSTDETAIARIAVDYLVSLGHRRIALFGVRAGDTFDSSVATTRYDACQQALDDHDVPVDGRLLIDTAYTFAGGAMAASELVRGRELPTAIFALSDEIAIGAMMRLQSLGVDVPSDISVIGVDDHEMSAFTGLTTVRQEVSRHGLFAARSMMTILADAVAAPTITHVETTLMVRSSCAPLA